MCDDRHRHQEWLKFLREIDDVVPAEKQIHMIVDNYCDSQTPQGQALAQRHPRFHMHFTPTGCSWLNMVERFFRDLTENRLRRGVFRNVEELIGPSMTTSIITTRIPNPSSGPPRPTTSSKRSSAPARP